ncbi:hypothetical protein AHAS_Ahas17G0275500 [Arachis hypogaea]
MAIKKGKEKASKKTPAKKATKRALAKALTSSKVKPTTKRLKRTIRVDEAEKEFPAKDSAKFTNRYCERMFPILIERNYHNEYLLTLSEHFVQFVVPRIERRQWGFLNWRSREANPSWVVELYTNYHLPTLLLVFVRQKQVPISEDAIQRVLALLPSSDGIDAYQEAQLARKRFDIDWDSILRVIALPGRE